MKQIRAWAFWCRRRRVRRFYRKYKVGGEVEGPRASTVVGIKKVVTLGLCLFHVGKVRRLRLSLESLVASAYIFFCEKTTEHR